MKISFHGATREVTGSCYLVDNGKIRILVDCGMFQGSAFSDSKNFQDFDFDPKTLSAVVVTHAHLDHVGRLPKLVKEGFKGKIYATPPTIQLAKIVLEDAVQIMADEYRRELRPQIYDIEDVQTTLQRFVGVEYSRKIKLDGLSFRFRDAGHILGSAFIEIEEDGGGRLAFSGDLGNTNDPILQPTAQLAEQDVLIMESTYGDRLHEALGEGDVLKDTIIKTAKQNGVLLIPSFAIERTQFLLYQMNRLIENRLVPQIDFYLDSPMAIKASRVFEEFPLYFNEKAQALFKSGDDIFNFTGLHTTLSRDDSKTINDAPRPKVIMAGSGMMNAGRIQHHLIRYLGSANTTVMIVGYQAAGTLGRRLFNGEKHVAVLNERVTVKAKIMTIGAYSAHADRKQLVHWIQSAARLPGQIYCTHGEENASTVLAARLREELGAKADVPRYGDIITV